MKIKVLGLRDGSSDVVMFESKTGNGFGRWMDKSVPTSGDFEIEFTLPDMSVEEITVQPSKPTGLYIDGDEIEFVGQIEGIEEGLFYLRIGDGLLMVGLKPGDFNLRVGQIISFRVTDVELYDTHI